MKMETGRRRRRVMYIHSKEGEEGILTAPFSLFSLHLAQPQFCLGVLDVWYIVV